MTVAVNTDTKALLEQIVDAAIGKRTKPDGTFDTGLDVSKLRTELQNIISTAISGNRDLLIIAGTHILSKETKTNAILLDFARKCYLEAEDLDGLRKTAIRAEENKSYEVAGESYIGLNDKREARRIAKIATKYPTWDQAIQIYIKLNETEGALDALRDAQKSRWWQPTGNYSLPEYMKAMPEVAHAFIDYFIKNIDLNHTIMEDFYFWRRECAENGYTDGFKKLAKKAEKANIMVFANELYTISNDREGMERTDLQATLSRAKDRVSFRWDEDKPSDDLKVYISEQLIPKLIKRAEEEMHTYHHVPTIEYGLIIKLQENLQKLSAQAISPSA